LLPPAQKNVAINLPTATTGTFIALLTPTTAPDMLFFNHPLTSDRKDQPSIPLVTPQRALGLAQNLNVVLDPALSVVLLRVYDCLGNPAAGINVTLDQGGQKSPNLHAFTFQNGLPVLSALVGTTDATGQFGFANALPIESAAHAYLTGADGQQIEIGEASFLLNPGWGTIVDLQP
jgi:hypothetical protein